MSKQKTEKGNLLFHNLDKWIGIPLVFILGLFKGLLKRNPPSQISRISILNLGSIGDNVLMSAVIADIVLQYPSAEIIAFTGASNYGIVKLIPGISNIIKLPITHPFKTINILKSQGEFDVSFDFGPWPRINAIYSFFINSKFNVGFKTKGHYRHYVYDQKIEHRIDVHEIDNHRRLVSHFYKGHNNDPLLAITESSKMNDCVKSYGKYCIIHPWSGGIRSELKQWSNSRWIELIYKISGKFDTILLSGAASDLINSAELFALADESFLSAKLINLAGQFNIEEAAFLAKRASCIVSVDTGISHIAAAFNSPLICLQGPASSLRWRPYNDTAIVINPQFGRYGYLLYGYEYNTIEENCMDNITVEQVYKEFLNMTKKNNI